MLAACSVDRAAGRGGSLERLRPRRSIAAELRRLRGPGDDGDPRWRPVAGLEAGRSARVAADCRRRGPRPLDLPAGAWSGGNLAPRRLRREAALRLRGP